MPNRIETLEAQGQLRRFYIDGIIILRLAVYRKSGDKCAFQCIIWGNGAV